MDAQLVNRAQAWLTLPGKEKTSGPGLQELGLVYSEITSTPVPDCIGCQYYPMTDTLQHYVNQFERFNTPTMANSNYIWNSEYKGQKIVLSSLGLNITEETLTDKSAEQAIEAGFGHVIKKKSTTQTQAEKAPEPKAPKSVAPKAPKAPKAPTKAEKAAAEQAAADKANADKAAADTQTNPPTE